MHESELLQLVQHRNSVETDPYRSIYKAHAEALNLIELLSQKNLTLEQDYLNIVDKLANTDVNETNKNNNKEVIKWKEKVVVLQEQLNAKMADDVQASKTQLNLTNEVTALKQQNDALLLDIEDLNKTNHKLQKDVEVLRGRLNEVERSREYMEQANTNLREKLDPLSEENLSLQTENQILVNRLVSEKEKVLNQMNELNEEIESLRKMLKEEQEFSSANVILHGRKEEQATDVLNNKKTNPLKSLLLKKSVHASNDTCDNNDVVKGRQWGDNMLTSAAIIPTQRKFTVSAHAAEITSVRYNSMNIDQCATSSSDGTVKVWSTFNGQCLGTFRSSTSVQPYLGVDFNGQLISACSADKSAYIWNIRNPKTNIQHLTGHHAKVTCNRFFPDGKQILTGSADRSMRVWDIDRRTAIYTATFRHGSSPNSVDLASSSSSSSIVSGHLDGGLRFWDVRTSERLSELCELHSNGITCVAWNPSDSSQLLTNGKDSTLKIVDVRMHSAVKTLYHQDFRTLFNWSSCAWSPDGKFVTAGSGSNGQIFVWDVTKEKVNTHLKEAHSAGVEAVAWSKGGSSGQQFASVDKSGSLILWS